jgi:hypothetical protein
MVEMETIVLALDIGTAGSVLEKIVRHVIGTIYHNWTRECGGKECEGVYTLPLIKCRIRGPHLERRDLERRDLERRGVDMGKVAWHLCLDILLHFAKPRSIVLYNDRKDFSDDGDLCSPLTDWKENAVQCR